jgi:hypothetical protein
MVPVQGHKCDGGASLISPRPVHNVSCFLNGWFAMKAGLHAQPDATKLPGMEVVHEK